MAGGTSTDQANRPVERARRFVLPLVAVGVTAALVALILPKEVASEPRFQGVRQTGFRRVPVVMVVFDEFPLVSLMDQRGEIDPRLYPNFARLAQDATWYRNAAAAGVFTKDALPAVLTGMAHDELGILEHHSRNLFTLLGDAYKIHTAEVLPGFCAPPLCPRPRQNENPISSRLNAFSGGGRGIDFGSFIDLVSKADPDEPSFFFVHSVMPHSPWRYLPSGQRYLETNPEPGEIDMPGVGRRWSNNGWLVTQVWQRHLLQVGLVDRLLGELAREMRKAGIYERSLMIVTADHGVAFEPGQPKRVLTPSTLGHVLPVPLFMKMPYQDRGWTSELPASLIDVLPTIADALDLSTSWPDIDGLSLLDIPAWDRNRVVDGFKLDLAGNEKWEVLQQKHDLFGADSQSASPFIVGPGHTERLLGRSMKNLWPWERGQELVEIIAQSRHEQADPTLGLFPALVEGTVVGARSLVAVAVNDRIVALTRSYGAGDRTSFYAMVDPEAFGSPPNELEAFVIRRVGAHH